MGQLTPRPEQKTQTEDPTDHIVVVEAGTTDYTPLIVTGFLGPLAVGVLLFVLRRFTKTRRPKL